MKTILYILLVALLPTVSTTAQEYTIDASHSLVQIQVTRFGVVDVVGRFKDLRGTVDLNQNDLRKTKLSATVLVSSYDANNSGGEKAVKSSAFLDAENFPEIKFVSSGTKFEEDSYYLIGELTIHGTTKTIAFPFNIKGPKLDLPSRKQSISLNATTTVNRQDYGVGFDKNLPDGTSVIGNDIKITIILLALEESE